MKKLLVAAFLVILALIWFHRERVFLRDPLATVYRDGVAQSGIQVFINGSNEVLMEKDGLPDPYRILVERSNPIPGTPTVLRCIRWMACLTDADQPTIIPLGSDSVAPQPPARKRNSRPSPAYDPQISIASRETSFTTPDHLHLRITLR
ncbi:MAG TPA: hypothetical protein VGU46_00645 [Acidobacteriaceae bacterium]|nr:hypothetical protein [Acidobacteriaceae bacterium]